MTPVRVRLLRTTAASRLAFGAISKGNCRHTSLIVSVSTLTEARPVVSIGRKTAVLDTQITETHAKRVEFLPLQRSSRERSVSLQR